ncbi:protein-L-isoaspartate O-methyltransferase [Hypoxylon rubiginosum]|uniref:Protein-L-isoaspartate O-methyltransferase n=1 Tax=Hypoxylon rubiginosum TaxID=110542 RepID=A0ACB9YHL9_9PEZI|nr:protein-L-isoaspartate O-methyltransferase [Hypoxylon rubiginosum]
MAWRSSGTSNAELVENLWRNKLITQAPVRSAFLRVDRAHYAPEPGSAYEDSPQPIGHGATISAPHMHANAVETLLPFLLPPPSPSPSRTEEGGGVKGHTGRPRRVLDIGSGSGYLTHVLAELAGESGVVVGLEHIPALQRLGEANMAKSAEGRHLLETGRARFRVGDGRKGWAEPAGSWPGVGGRPANGNGNGNGGNNNGSSSRNGRVETGDTRENGNEEGEEGEGGGWDAIHVGAAAAELHEELVRQLRSPGRMFIPVDAGNGWEQHIWTVDKDERGTIRKQRLYGVRYVPLTDAPTS